jgi:CheY-like chemotaxis protein
MPPQDSSQPISVLLIEPHGGLALKLQEWLIAHFHTTLDLGIARSLREGLAYLCTHRVTVIVTDLALPDYKGLDAVRALRMSEPTSAVVAFSTVVNEALLLDAIRAGAHEALSLTAPAAPEFRLVIDRAMVRAGQSESGASGISPIRQLPALPAWPKLAHDLNNAMMSINGFADLLLTRLPVNDPARSSAEQIRKAGERATVLVKAMTPPPASAPATPAPLPITAAHAA